MIIYKNIFIPCKLYTKLNNDIVNIALFSQR